VTSHNNVFTHRRTSHLGRQRHFGEVDSGDTFAPPNRIAAAHYRSLKVVGRREHGNVI